MGFDYMNRPEKKSRQDNTDSLLERAAQIYDFGEIMRDRNADIANGFGDSEPVAEVPVAVEAIPAPGYRPAMPKEHTGPVQIVDRDKLRAAGFIVPGGAVTGISEEFRIVKRQLLQQAAGGKHADKIEYGERILICSAQTGEGKTFCAVNLALSIAAEKDNEVLLIDADFAKPSILDVLGIGGERGLMDALSDPELAIEDCIIPTDVVGLSVLSAGAQTNNDTEFLASARTRQVLDQLTRHNPRRIVIFDSPPVLAASPASELAMHVGQAVMIVRADRTTENALRDALGLMAGCENIQLLLNSAKFSPTGRSFGSYYGYGE